jgi:acetyltransferase-like isoleucine patch superfamily enzyme
MPKQTDKQMKTLKLIYQEFRIRVYERLLISLANLLTISSTFKLSSLKCFSLRLVGMKISSPCFIDKGFNCWSPQNIEIDKCCSFGHNNNFWAFNKISIGPYVQTAYGVTLIAGSHDINNFAPIGNQEIALEGENWIGANVTIIGGVTIGRGAVIAAGAVVVNNIPPYCVAGGVPAKVIKERTPAELIVHPFGSYTPNAHGVRGFY